MKTLISLLCLLGTLAPGAFSQTARRVDPQLEHRQFTVEGVVRETLVYVPTSAHSKATPMVFIFHGHGGNATNAARSFATHRYWPEAIAVYPQGLKTPGRLTDPEGKRSGWQQRLGDQGDRDLKFFDVVLAKLKSDFKVNTKRVFSTGHSNGGAFTYLLWETRGEVLTAVAPSAAAGLFWEKLKLKPKPVLHLAGENDTLVKYEWQQRTMEMVRKINRCEPDGKPWEGKLTGPGVCTLYESKTGSPFVSFIHPGGHGFPAAGPELIATFFQRF